MTDGAIRLRNVSKTYGRDTLAVTIFEHMSLTIEPGEFIAIMGPSGSGKSTLLHLIGGLDRASAGEVECDGQRLDRMSEAGLTRWRAQSVGFVFQFYNLMPWLSAAANIELPLLLTRMSRAERARRVATSLDIVDLAERASHRPAALSGGQQQRVAIARAIVADPRLLLCDEPTGDLDRQSADNVLDLLKVFNQEFGKTIVMVTHDPVAASRASRILQLDKGRFVDGGVDMGRAVSCA